MSYSHYHRLEVACRRMPQRQGDRERVEGMRKEMTGGEGKLRGTSG